MLREKKKPAEREKQRERSKVLRPAAHEERR